MSKAKIIRGMAVFDLHFGWERGHSGGQWVVRPTFAEEAIRKCVSFARDYKPEILVLGGDQLNCGPISHWNYGKPKLTEDFRLREEMEALNDIFLGPMEAIVPKKPGSRIWHDGNHEAWILDHVATFPGVDGLVEPQNFLHLEKRGWTLRSQGELSNIGKLYFTHGDGVFKGSGPANPAQKLLNAYHRNIRAGHLHTLYAATEEMAIDSRDFHTAIVLPSMSTRAPFYVKGAPTKSINGFLVFEVDLSTGNFNDAVIIVGPDGFQWNGKKY